MTARDAAEVAAGLAQRWHNLRRRHVAVAFGCACGAPVGHISLADLEGDILAYLRHRYPPGHDSGVDAMFPPGWADEHGGLVKLLQRLAAPVCGTSAAMAQLAVDLERGIASCERSMTDRRKPLRADAENRESRLHR